MDKGEGEMKDEVKEGNDEGKMNDQVKGDSDEGKVNDKEKKEEKERTGKKETWGGSRLEMA